MASDQDIAIVSRQAIDRVGQSERAFLGLHRFRWTRDRIREDYDTIVILIEIRIQWAISFSVSSSGFLELAMVVFRRGE